MPKTGQLIEEEKDHLLLAYANPKFTDREIERSAGKPKGYLSRLRSHPAGQRLLAWAVSTGEPTHFVSYKITDRYPLSVILHEPGKLIPGALDLEQFTKKDEDDDK